MPPELQSQIQLTWLDCRRLMHCGLCSHSAKLVGGLDLPPSFMLTPYSDTLNAQNNVMKPNLLDGSRRTIDRDEVIEVNTGTLTSIDPCVVVFHTLKAFTEVLRVKMETTVNLPA